MWRFVVICALISAPITHTHGLRDDTDNDGDKAFSQSLPDREQRWDVSCEEGCAPNGPVIKRKDCCCPWCYESATATTEATVSLQKCFWSSNKCTGCPDCLARVAAKARKAVAAAAVKEVAVIGGGPVGLYMAARMYHQGHIVTLSESYSKPGEWNKTLSAAYTNPNLADYFTRPQVLLVQNLRGDDDKYQSLDRLKEVLSPALYQELLAVGCQTDALPNVVGNVNCGELRDSDDGTPPTSMTISVRDLQLVLAKNIVDLATADPSRMMLKFVNRGISYTDAWGEVGWMDKKNKPQWDKDATDAQSAWWTECSGTADVLSSTQFADCWKKIKHNNTDPSYGNFGEFRSTRVTSLMAMICGRCTTIDKDTFIRAMNAESYKPDILLCADGASGKCSGASLDGQRGQQIQQTNPEVYLAYGLLFLIKEVPDAFRAKSTGLQLAGKAWPYPQHRFRIFATRGDTEVLYLAAGLSKPEYENYKAACTQFFKGGPDKNRGGLCPNIDKAWGKQDMNLESAMQYAIQDDNAWRHVRWLDTLFKNSMRFARVPEEHQADLHTKVTTSAFPVDMKEAMTFSAVDTEGQLRAVVGDAAMTVHFFSFTGVNTGFKSAALMGDLIEQAYIPEFAAGSLGDNVDRKEAVQSALQRVFKQTRVTLDPTSLPDDAPGKDDKIAYLQKRRETFPTVGPVKDKVKTAIGDISNWGIGDPIIPLYQTPAVVQNYNWIAEALLLNDHLLTSYDVMHRHTYNHSKEIASTRTYGDLSAHTRNHATLQGIDRNDDWKACPWDVSVQLARRFWAGGIQSGHAAQDNHNWITDAEVDAKFNKPDCASGVSLFDEVDSAPYAADHLLGKLLKTDPSLPRETMAGLWIATVETKTNGAGTAMLLQSQFIYDITNEAKVGKALPLSGKVYKRAYYDRDSTVNYWKISGEQRNNTIEWVEADERGASLPCKGKYNIETKTWTCQSNGWDSQHATQPQYKMTGRLYEYGDDRDTLCALYEANDDATMHTACIDTPEVSTLTRGSAPSPQGQHQTF